MKITPDKNVVRNAFSQAASDYERWAEHQRVLAEKLVDTFPADFAGPVLDVGCGTGLLTQSLLRRFPNTKLLGIDISPEMVAFCRDRFLQCPSVSFETADADDFESADGFRWIVSNCAVQWLATRETCGQRFAQMLEPNGGLAICVPIEGMLPELTASYEAATGRKMPSLHLWSDAQYVDAIRAGGGSIECADVVDVMVDYPEAYDVLRALKGIGASLSDQPGCPKLSVKEMQRLSAWYADRFSNDQGKVCATYRALLLVARKGEA